MKVPLAKYAVSFNRVMLQRCHNEGQKSPGGRALLSLQFKSVQKLFTRFFLPLGNRAETGFCRFSIFMVSGSQRVSRFLPSEKVEAQWSYWLL